MLENADVVQCITHFHALSHFNEGFRFRAWATVERTYHRRTDFMAGGIFRYRRGNAWCRGNSRGGYRCRRCHWYGVLNRRRRTTVNANRFFPFRNLKFHNAGFFYKFDQFFNFTNIHNCFSKRFKC